MPQIENRGWAGLFVESNGEEVQIEDPSLLKRLNGFVLFEEEVAEFLQDGSAAQKALYQAGVRGGVPRVVFDPNTSAIHCSVIYESPRTLSQLELETLRNYTDDQLMDGFGSNPVDTPVLGEGYFLHLGTEQANEHSRGDA
jgi:hypothetical protein